MKRLYFLPAACLLLALPLSAQENLKNENLRTLSADSILTGDARALPLSAQENLKNENLRTLSADSILTGDARMDSLRGGLHHERGPFVPDV